MPWDWTGMSWSHSRCFRWAGIHSAFRFGCYNLWLKLVGRASFQDLLLGYKDLCGRLDKKCLMNDQKKSWDKIQTFQKGKATGVLVNDPKHKEFLDKHLEDHMVNLIDLEARVAFSTICMTQETATVFIFTGVNHARHRWLSSKMVPIFRSYVLFFQRCLGMWPIPWPVFNTRTERRSMKSGSRSCNVFKALAWPATKETRKLHQLSNHDNPPLLSYNKMVLSLILMKSKYSVSALKCCWTHIIPNLSRAITHTRDKNEVRSSFVSNLYAVKKSWCWLWVIHRLQSDEDCRAFVGLHGWLCVNGATQPVTHSFGFHPPLNQASSCEGRLHICSQPQASSSFKVFLLTTNLSK